MSAKTSDWRPGPTVCRCCLSEGCYKDISTEYFWMGKREVYIEMLTETFDLNIAFSQTTGPNSNSRLICESCISRLRDATEFKRQVRDCEKTFLNYLDPSTSSIIEADEQLAELEKDVKLECVKEEALESDDDDDYMPPADMNDDEDDDDDDDLDNQPLTKLASKMPKTESLELSESEVSSKKTPSKRKSTIKLKETPPKKAKTKKDSTKATASKTVAKTEKKKKETEPANRFIKARKNAEVFIKYSTVYPFRITAKNLMCVFCWDEYDNPCDYRDHMNKEHLEFSTATAFHHIKKRRTEYIKVDITDMKCRLCRKPFSKIDEMAKHIYEDHDIANIDMSADIGVQPYRLTPDNLVCLICDKKVPSLTTLCRHTQTHYHTIVCEVCGRGYLSNAALKYHVKFSHSDKKTCQKCSKSFDTAEEKKAHLIEFKQCRPFCCILCGERFLSWESKSKHLQDLHGHSKQLFDCTDCDERFESKKKFYKHFKLMHTKDAHVCSCGMKFNLQSELKEHAISHTGEKAFKCSVCFKYFSRSGSLNTHMWTHREDKRFACMMCCKQFNQKVTFRSHMKTHHPEVVL